MKIAILAPIEESVPPHEYGGTEAIVYGIANGMGKKGHQVDLFASGDSKKESYYNLIPIVEKSLRSDQRFSSNLNMRGTAKFMGINEVIIQLKKKKYDIIHNHNGWRFLIFSDLFKDTPLITTHHGPLNMDYQNLVFAKYKNLPYVSISDNQRKDLPELNYVRTIYNGIDIESYRLVKDSVGQKYEDMVFLARMNDEKGAIEAALIAIHVNKKLIVMAKVDKVDQPYFAKFSPYIDNQKIIFLGEVNIKSKVNYLQNARCLIAPIKWEEPFGLMFTEAMACGTPVIAFARGSVPEIIVDGSTGFIVNSSEDDIRGDWIIKKTGIEGLCEAVEKMYSLSREDYGKMRKECREHVEKNFAIDQMVKAYEGVYSKLISEKKNSL